MKKAFVSLAAIALISSAVSMDVLAFDIQKGRLIKHTQSTTGNVLSASIKELSPQKIALKLKTMRQKTNTSSANVTVNLLNPIATPVVIGIPTEISSESYAAVRNDSTETKRYIIVSEVCVMDDSCAFFTDDVELNPGGSFEFGASPTLNVSFSEEGSRDILSFIHVSSYNDEAPPTVMMSGSMGSVEVLNNIRK